MNCKIIQDLLPLYADGISSEETNEVVREHIAECEECGKIYEKMTERPPSIESPQNDRDVDYMKKIKSRGRKITAAIVGGLTAAAVALLCLKLFYWGFAVSSEDIDILCTMNSQSEDAVCIEFSVTMKNGMMLMYDETEYNDHDCRCTYLTPKAVFRMPFDMPKDQSSFLIGYNMYKRKDGVKHMNHEMNIILQDTSYKYDIDRMAEEFFRNMEE